jgi:SAM-dependent methyltransferase
MADELAVTSGTAQRLRFITGDISNTGWSDHSFDGALSMDVLLFVPDKRAALQEVARILKLGGRFVGTTWELRADSAALSVPAFDEYPSAFRDAGFTIEVYEETRNWRSLLTNALGALVASEDAVRKEVGGPGPNGFWRGLGRALPNSNIVEEFASAFVNSAILTACGPLPVCPHEQTLLGRPGMSERCQKPTHARELDRLRMR